MKQTIERRHKQTNMEKNTNSWDDFCGSNFLKVTNVANEKDAFVIVGVEVFKDEKENSAKPRLTLEKAGESFLFDLNVTNSNFCKNKGINSPKALVGKKMFFKKVLVNSPKTKKEVESLRVCDIE
jgi:ABC-type tungstate transport system permease subunit